MDWMQALTEGGLGALNGVINLMKFVIPIMLALEILRDAKVLDRLVRFLHPTVKFMGLSKEGTFPLLVGLVFGISYGAGVLIQATKEENLPHHERHLIGTFLSLCHAVFEDTLLFAAIGASAFILIGARLAMAVAFTTATLVFRRWYFADSQRVLGRNSL